MQQKINLEQYRENAKEMRDEFKKVEQIFIQNPRLKKLNRKANKIPYSYIWYQDPHTQQKIAIRLANKNVEGHVLGAGAFGRAKYGVDKYGRLYAVKIQHLYNKYGFLNFSKLSTDDKALFHSNQPIPNIEQTFFSENGILYFQASKNQPATEVPFPQEQPELEPIYNWTLNLANDPQKNSESFEIGTDSATVLIKLLLASNIDLSKEYNISNTPVSESAIAQDVQLAYGEKTQRATQSFILKIGLFDNQPLEYGKLYLFNNNGKLAYTMLNQDNIIISREMDERWPRSQAEFDSLKSQIKAFAKRQGDIPRKGSSEQLTGAKQYQVLQLGELTLDDALQNKKPPLKEKLSITRRLLWEVSKLHTGKLSKSHKGYIHCDLKPANILLNPQKNNLLLIDYGMSVSADTKPTLRSTILYNPVVTTNLVLRGSSAFDLGYKERVQNLGTGFDVFALKRTIRMPQSQIYRDGLCIFTSNEWQSLPPGLKEGIEIGNDVDSTKRGVENIIKYSETALDLAMRFLAQEAVQGMSLSRSSRVRDTYDTNIQKLMSIPQQKERVCECAELLDLIQTHDFVPGDLSLQEIINAAVDSDPQTLLNLYARLLKLSCLVLLDPKMGISPQSYANWRDKLDTLEGYIVNKNDTALTILYQTFQKIKDADHAPQKNNQLSTIYGELKTRLKNQINLTNYDSIDENQSSAQNRNVEKPITKMKDRLFSMKGNWTLCLWENEAAVTDTHTIFVNTTQPDGSNSIQIEFRWYDANELDNVKKLSIDPIDLGLTDLSFPLSKKNLLDKIAPNIDNIVRMIEQVPYSKPK